jgi:hypothetical protein
MTKAGRPVRDGQTGVVAGDQPAGNNQQKGQSGNKNGKAMMSGIVGGRGQNCSLKVPIILTSDVHRASNEPASPHIKSLKHRGTEEAEDF